MKTNEFFAYNGTHESVAPDQSAVTDVDFYWALDTGGVYRTETGAFESAKDCASFDTYGPLDDSSPFSEAASAQLRNNKPKETVSTSEDTQYWSDGTPLPGEDGEY